MQLFCLGEAFAGREVAQTTGEAHYLCISIVAGEDTEEIKPVVNTLRNQGIRPIFASNAVDR